jgi:hypothetical protein
VNGFWTGAGVAQQVAITAASAWNAAYFSLQARRGPRARRIAAGVLALFCAAVALEALAGIPAASTAAEVVRRTPLLLTTWAIAVLVAYRPMASAPVARSDASHGGAR